MNLKSKSLLIALLIINISVKSLEFKNNQNQNNQNNQNENYNTPYTCEGGNAPTEIFEVDNKSDLDNKMSQFSSFCIYVSYTYDNFYADDLKKLKNRDYLRCVVKILFKNKSSNNSLILKIFKRPNKEKVREDEFTYINTDKKNYVVLHGILAYIHSYCNTKIN